MLTIDYGTNVSQIETRWLRESPWRSDKVPPYKVFRKIIPSLNMKYLCHLSWKVYGIGLENCQCNSHHKRNCSSKTLFKTFSCLVWFQLSRFRATCLHLRYMYVSEGNLSHEQTRSTFMNHQPGSVTMTRIHSFWKTPSFTRNIKIFFSPIKPRFCKDRSISIFMFIIKRVWTMAMKF